MINYSYSTECDRSPKIIGWDEASLLEFDRRWYAGQKTIEIAKYFHISREWATRIARRRDLPRRVRKIKKVLNASYFSPTAFR